MTRLLTFSIAGLALAALAGRLQAQTANWTAPTLGYVYDAGEKTLRPISGIPGAAGIESGLAVASKLEQAWVSPSRRYALGAMHGGGVSYLRLSGGTASAEVLDGALETPELVAWSPSSDTVAIYGGARLQVWTGIDTAPALARQMDVPVIAALAIANGGAAVAGAWNAGILLWQGGSAEAESIAGDFKALQFTASGALIAAGPGTLLLLRSGAEPEVLAGSEIGGLTAMALSADGRKLIAASDDGASVLEFDLESRAAARIGCECRGADPQRLQGNAVFRLTGIAEDQVLIYDGDSAEPRVLAIPFAGGRQ